MNPAAEPLPLDVKLMNACALVLSLFFVAMVVLLFGAWVMNKPTFGLSAIRVQGDIQHNNAVTLRANVAPRLAGNSGKAWRSLPVAAS